MEAPVHPILAAAHCLGPSAIGLDDALRGQSRRIIILYSDIDTIASITLVSKEMRGAFIECRDELVTRLLDLRSPRMAKVLKCLKDDGCEVTDNVTDLYRRTIAAENRTSTALTWSPSPPVDLGTVNLSFELAISDVPRQSSPDEFQADRVASWAAPLGPHFNIGPDWSMNPHDISVRIPADAIRDLELPLVWSDEVKDQLQHGTHAWPWTTLWSMRMKVYVTAATEEGILTTVFYDGGIDEGYPNDDTDVHFTLHDVGSEDGRNPFEIHADEAAHDEAVLGSIDAVLQYSEPIYSMPGLVNGDELEYKVCLYFKVLREEVDPASGVYVEGLDREQQVLFMKNIVASMSQ